MYVRVVGNSSRRRVTANAGDYAGLRLSRGIEEHENYVTYMHYHSDSRTSALLVRKCEDMEFTSASGQTLPARPVCLLSSSW